MDMKEAVRICLGKRYAEFSTRATRKEFWSFMLFYYLLCLCLFSISIIMDMLFDSIQLFKLTVGISVIISLFLMIPTLAVCVRRLHDTGRCGWWLLLYLLPYIGIIALLIMFCQKSDRDNKYGPELKS